jgi:hypothetical protein
MKALIICVALLFGGFGTIGSLVAFSTSPAGACQLGRWTSPTCARTACDHSSLIAGAATIPQPSTWTLSRGHSFASQCASYQQPYSYERSEEKRLHSDSVGGCSQVSICDVVQHQRRWSGCSNG